MGKKGYTVAKSKKTDSAPEKEEAAEAKPEAEPEKEAEAEKVEASEEATTEAKQEEKKSAGSKKPWWMTGNQAKDAAEKEYQLNRRQPFRVWMRGGEEAELIFLDDEGFAFWEHELKIAGKWGNYATCLRGIDPKGCPLCNHFGRNHRYIITMRTVVDTRGFDTKAGEHRDWSVKLLAAKDKTNKIIERRRKTKGSLFGAKYMVSRTDAKAPRCGDDYEFMEEVDVAQFKYKDQQGNVVVAAPYEYQKIFEPLDFATLKGMIVEASVDEDDAGDMDEDVPF